MTNFIFTADGQAGPMAVNEIIKIMDCKLLSYIAPGVGLMETALSFDHISSLIREHTVFIRHIFPVARAVHFQYDSMDGLLTDMVSYGASALKKDGTFSLQTRLYIEDIPVKRNYINETVAGRLTAEGFEKSYKRPDQVLSVVIGGEMVYYGVSETTLNLSHWAGGECRFKKDETTISRAEFKLLEALDVFELDLSGMKAALDLGAAPGGWTKVLLEKGLRVASVDPGALDERVSSMPGVEIYACLAQHYFEKYDQKFDLIVNDMKMDAFESIRLMETAFSRLEDSGICVMTLKLKSSHAQTQMNKALKQLKGFCRVLHARQLYHNRSEVTVVLGRV